MINTPILYIYIYTIVIRARFFLKKNVKNEDERRLFWAQQIAYISPLRLVTLQGG